MLTGEGERCQFFTIFYKGDCTMSQKALMLRALIRQGHVFAYGVSSPLTARIAELTGHKALYAGGYAAAAERLLPDMGILTQTEMLQHVKYIARAVSVPVMADIDDGYGGAHNVQRTVEDVITETDAAGFHWEDQKYPKRCGHIAGKEILPIQEAVGKLKLAIATRDRLDSERVVMARTDAFSAAGGKRNLMISGDIEEAIVRGCAYADVGADLVWCEFPAPDKMSAEMFAAGMRNHLPVLGLGFNISPSFNWCATAYHVRYQDLIDFGYTFLFATYPSIVASVLASQEWAQRFSGQGTQIEALKHLQREANGTMAESIMQLVGVPAYQLREEQYSPHAAQNLRTSDGFKV